MRCVLLVFPCVSASELGLAHLVVFVDEFFLLPFLLFDEVTFLLSVMQEGGALLWSKVLRFLFLSMM